MWCEGSVICVGRKDKRLAMAYVMSIRLRDEINHGYKVNHP